MNRTILKLLVDRTQIALGSLALVEKQLLEIHTVVDKQIENVYADTHKGEEKNSDQDFFITPPLEAYDGEI